MNKEQVLDEMNKTLDKHISNEQIKPVMKELLKSAFELGERYTKQSFSFETFEKTEAETTIKNKTYKIRTMARFGGLQWLYSYNGHTLSIILNNASYGRKLGLFEIMPSWRKPSRYDSVKGYLTFGDVQKWINELGRQPLKEVKP